MAILIVPFLILSTVLFFKRKQSKNYKWAFRVSVLATLLVAAYLAYIIIAFASDPSS